MVGIYNLFLKQTKPNTGIASHSSAKKVLNNQTKEK